MGGGNVIGFGLDENGAQPQIASLLNGLEQQSRANSLPALVMIDAKIQETEVEFDG